jgi:hypothetical protein
MAEQRRTEVRSYRSVFALERRIYRIDRLRLNPTGVPVRGVAWAAVLLVAAQVAQALPGVGTLAAVAPWPLRDLVAPIGLGAALTTLRLDGRHAHHALFAALRFASSARHLSGFAPCAAIGTIWRPGPLVTLPDGSENRLRSLRYRGPGRLLVSVAHTARQAQGVRGGRLEIHPAARGDRQSRGISVARGGRVRVGGEGSWLRR